jgi:putative oxidoreductase
VNLALPSLARFGDLTLFGLRAVTGGFLMHETWDNVTSAARMDEFAEFLSQFGFPLPWLLAPLSVAVQFVCGALLVLGLLTRWAGLLIAVNFAIAMVMVHRADDVRTMWPALVLVFLGLHFAAAGSGKLGLDALVFRKGRGGA